MKGFVGELKSGGNNSDFRRVIYTGKNLQLVLMSLKPGEDIGEEVHKDRDQFFRIEKGKGEVVIDGKRSKIKGDDAVLVPAGARHNIINTGEKPLASTPLRSSRTPGWNRACDQGRRPTPERAF